MSKMQLRFPRSVHSLCLLILAGCGLWSPKCVAMEPPCNQSLLQDTDFAEGFGAAFIYGKALHEANAKQPPTR